MSVFIEKTKKNRLCSVQSTLQCRRLKVEASDSLQKLLQQTQTKEY